MKRTTTIRRSAIARVVVVARLRKLAAAAASALALLLALPASAQNQVPTDTQLIVADFNHDGIPDALVPSRASGGFTLSFGAVPYGTFNPVSKLVTYPSGCTNVVPNGVVVGDFNGDGLPDLAMVCTGAPTDSSNYTIYVLLGSGDGTFATSSTTYTGLSNLVVGNFNKNGVLDLVAVGSSGEEENQALIFLQGKGDGTFTQTGSQSFDNSSYITAVAVDVDGDGYPDLALGNFGNSDSGYSLDVFGNNQNGTFGKMGDFTIPNVSIAFSSGGNKDTTILTGNFFGTGLTDLAVVNAGSTPGLYVLQNTSSTGSYSFAKPTAVSSAGLVNAVTGNFVSGFSDFLVSNGTTLSVLANDGTGNFSNNYATLSVANTSVLFAAADANGDGHADVYTATTTANAASITVNLVSGSATAVSQPFSLPNPGAIPVSASWTGNINLAGSTANGTQNVNPIIPTINWQTPAPITYGTPLSATQLNATATSVYTDGAVPGTFQYTPAAGAILAPGTQTLNVVFTPTDPITFTAATGSVSIRVNQVPLALTSFTPNSGLAGAGATTITITGAGFDGTTVAQVNGTSIATTLVNSTKLTAVIPASGFTTAGTLNITLADSATDSLTGSLPFTVLPPTAAGTITAPTTTPPGSQPTINFALTSPYPLPLVATFTLNDKSGVATGVTDPAVQFATGGMTYTVNIPAGTMTIPPIQVQAGTLAATITVPVTLTANGVNVTPSSLAATIVVPAAVPAISVATLARTGNTLTVTVTGFSNTLDIVSAGFHFTPIAGATLATPDFTANVGSVFAAYFALPSTLTYGSTFVYTQVFNVSDSASNIASVQVTLTNSVGISTTQTTQ